MNPLPQGKYNQINSRENNSSTDTSKLTQKSVLYNNISPKRIFSCIQTIQIKNMYTNKNKLKSFPKQFTLEGQIKDVVCRRRRHHHRSVDRKKR